jgi:uncharacterized protein YcfL
MKSFTTYLLTFVTAASVLTGCTTTPAKPPVNGAVEVSQSRPKFTAIDSRAQYSVMCTGLQERKTEDGRLEVAANLKNKENRRIEVQTQCVFLDPQGFSVDETPWQTLILSENALETVRFSAMNNRATDYEVRVRASR